MRDWLVGPFFAIGLALGPAAGLAQVGDASSPVVAAERWNAASANEWCAAQPWLSGANFLPSTASNQIEMFQADTFDPATIDRELGWAQRTLGFDTVRVDLHDLLWEKDAEGFKLRLDRFLAIAAGHGIRPVLVLFDSCWDPDPVLGPQRRPVPGVHNSRWVHSPGRRALVDPAHDEHFRAYIEGVVGAFASDRRILAWDVWNEPDNPGGGSYNDEQLPGEAKRIAELLPQAFEWARSRYPVQPLTSALWRGRDWSPGSPSLTPIQRTQIEEPDVLTFHNYEEAGSFEARIRQLRPYGRPIICTEWMARSAGSTVDAILPVGRREGVGMLNWGLVDGASQTRFPWDSWEHSYDHKEPSVWFHDLLRRDGTPYDEHEAAAFRKQRERLH